MQSSISALTFEFVQSIFNQRHSSQFIPTASEKLHATVMVEFLLEKNWLPHEPAVGMRPT